MDLEIVLKKSKYEMFGDYLGFPDGLSKRKLFYGD